MDKAKLFINGRSQAVRLPKAYRFEGEEVLIKRVGAAVILFPQTHSWQTLFESLEQFEPGLKLQREQPEQQQIRNKIGK